MGAELVLLVLEHLEFLLVLHLLVPLLGFLQPNLPAADLDLESGYIMGVFLDARFVLREQLILLIKALILDFLDGHEVAVLVLDDLERSGELRVVATEPVDDVGLHVVFLLEICDFLYVVDLVRAELDGFVESGLKTGGFFLESRQLYVKLQYLGILRVPLQVIQLLLHLRQLGLHLLLLPLKLLLQVVLTLGFPLVLFPPLRLHSLDLFVDLAELLVLHLTLLNLLLQENILLLDLSHDLTQVQGVFVESFLILGDPLWAHAGVVLVGHVVPEEILAAGIR